MRRWLTAMVFLLVVAGLASADYVVVIVNLAVPKAPPLPKGGVGGMGAVGGFGQVGRVGQVGDCRVVGRTKPVGVIGIDVAVA